MPLILLALPAVLRGARYARSLEAVCGLSVPRHLRGGLGPRAPFPAIRQAVAARGLVITSLALRPPAEGPIAGRAVSSTLGTSALA